MLKQFSIAEARDQFTSLVRDVEQDTTVELTRRGKPVAVLMSIQEYQRLQSHRKGFWDAYTAFRDKVNLQKLDIQPELFTELRDTSPGREVDL
jgi:prevent-host-death family protein